MPTLKKRFPKRPNEEGDPMRARRLAIVHDSDETIESTPTLRVAFASSDRKTIDQHFGSATSFVVHAVAATSSRFLEVLEFAPELQDGNEGKLAGRIEALSGCNAVYVQAIGASAVGQLRSKGIHAQKAERGTPIGLLITQLQQQIASAPPAWVSAAIAGTKDPDRFDAMEEEGWDE
jgi:nitrogen fixation protein NifX